MNKQKYLFGSVSHATMLKEDLIPLFAELLKELAEKENKRHGGGSKIAMGHWTTADDILRECEKEGYYDTEESDYDLNETLFDALNYYAAPYFYFGSHPGDGSDYGFWLYEFFEDDFEDLKVEDLADVPDDHEGEVLVINDHGNMTLYSKTGDSLEEIWAIV